MPISSEATVFSGDPVYPDILPFPPELPDLPREPRVLELADVDAVSHGLVEGTPRERASDLEMRECLGRVHATAVAVDPQARMRCAASTETAKTHLDVLMAAKGNIWTIRRGLDGADRALLEEMDELVSARMIATRPGHKQRPARLPSLVVLVGQDKIYAAPTRRLRLLGISVWVLSPSRFIAADLYRAASAVSFIGPDCRA